MGKGYTGKILTVDLTHRDIREEIIPDDVYERYLSGVGLGAWWLYNRIEPGANPLGPDNILGFVSGLLTGTGALFTGRWMVVGKSPLTGGWGEANCGGYFSPAIKRCGYDGIFFSGASDKPVYLSVDPDSASLHDASHLWGKDTVETEKILIRSATGKKKPRVACIGPAGERQSLIAGIAHDRGRMAARAGLGAVMGAKKLKAVVLAGSERINPHNRTTIRALNGKCKKYVQFQPPFVTGPLTAYVGALMRWLPTQMAMDGMLYKIMLQKWGTVSMNQMSVEMGDAPVKNWIGSNKDFGPRKSRPVNPDVFIDRELTKYHCFACPLGCGGICKGTGKYEKTHKPEYETVLSLGGLCLNEDPDSIFYMNELLNRAGMDTISAGGTIAFAIECYENGIINQDDTGGLVLTWGNTDAIVALLRLMIRREGIGDLLADGVRVAAEKIGGEAGKYAIHAGGQMLPMHDGRNDPGFALHYSVEPAPGKHTTGSQMYYEMFRLWKKVKDLPTPFPLYLKWAKYRTDIRKIRMAAACSKYMAVVNGAGGCLFGAFLGADRLPIFEYLNSATGWDNRPEAYMEIGERIQTLRQLFNIKQGIEPKNNMASPRVLGRPALSAGANKGRTLDMEKMMADYWSQFGWDTASGEPLPKTLDRLGIGSGLDRD